MSRLGTDLYSVLRMGDWLCHQSGKGFWAPFDVVSVPAEACKQVDLNVASYFLGYGHEVWSAGDYYFWVSISMMRVWRG